jgi:uncharacterized protein YdeI (YjbR/CyaY-like superfamily)
VAAPEERRLMKMAKTVHMTDARRWRAWLAANHAKQKEVWLVFFKKHTGRPNIAYEDAVCEALCFGWIDSLIQRIDDDSYARKFTPRADNDKWSALNKARVARMVKAGRMTPAGLAKAGDLKSKPTAAPPRLPKDLPPPPDLVAALRREPRAWSNFQALAPSYRRRYVGWIIIAKKEETRRKRIAEAVRLLARNQKLGLK